MAKSKATRSVSGAKVWAAAFLIHISLQGTALANTVVQFHGVVDSISLGYEIPGIFVGDEVHGTLTFDSDIPDGSSLTSFGYYPDAIVSFYVSMGAKTFALSTAGNPASEIDVINDENIYGTFYDQMLFRVAAEDIADPDVTRFFQLSFSSSASSPPDILLSDALLAEPGLDDFVVTRGFITYLPPGASQGNNFALTDIKVIPSIESRGYNDDFNGDGIADVLMRNADTGRLRLWLMVDADYIQLDVGPLNPIWEIIDLADFNSDLKVDILMRNSATGRLQFWQMEGELFSVKDVGPLSLLWSVEGTGDFGGDGRSDLLLRHGTTGDLVLWEMNDNSYTESPAGWLRPEWDVEAIGDFEADGRDDILLRHRDLGRLRLWQMDGPTHVQIDLGGFSLDWDVEGVADFDGDGRVEILVRHKVLGRVRQLVWDGASLNMVDVLGLKPEWRIIGIKDYTGDAKADILLRHDARSRLRMWEMDGTSVTQHDVGPLNAIWEVQ